MRASFPCFGSGTVALKGFFGDLGAELVLPPPPTRRTLEIGVRYSPEQICLPFKITLGNLIESLELGADTLFTAAGTRKCRFGYYHLVQERILAELGGARLYGLSQYSAYDFVFRRIPEIFGVSAARSARAVSLLLARSSLVHDLDNTVRRLRPVRFQQAEQLLRDGLTMIAQTRTLAEIRDARHELKTAFRRTETADSAIRIGLVGEVYLMLEPFANAEIEKELGRLGVEVRTERSLYKHLRHLLKSDLGYLPIARYARKYIGESPGGEVTKTLGESIKFAREGIDGIIHIFPFTCMPENMALEILQKIGEDYQVPIMSLSFDKHTSKTGLVTRLEAFVDMISRRAGAKAQKACA